MWDSVILLTLIYLLPSPPTPESTGERGLEVRCHGDWPPLPVDLCVCVRVRHNGHVYAAALPELHSQDHHQPARLTICRPWTWWQLPQPISTAGQGLEVGGGGVWVLLCLLNRNQNCNWTAITPITFILTFFAKNNIFLVWREKKKTSYSYLQIFVQKFHGLTSPFWWKGLSLLFSSWGAKMLWFNPCWTLWQPIYTFRLTLTA